MQALMKRVSEAKKSGDQNAMMVASSNLQKLFKDYKVNPFGPLIMPLFQMPVFLGMFYALKALAYAPLPQLKDGGMLWLTDLTACDPYCILPITSFFFQLAVFKVGIDGTGPNGAQSARTMAHFRNGMMALSPLIIYTVWNFPAVSV
jgi:YidC/Oxa1 family membrane protein insertase